MVKHIISTDKIKLLDELVQIYKYEIDAIYAIGIVWTQLSDKAKNKCAEDFDQAIIARETLLEELAQIKEVGNKLEGFDVKLSNVDKTLLLYNKVVKEIYGLDVKAFLNVKQPKGLLKSGK